MRRIHPLATVLRLAAAGAVLATLGLAFLPGAGAAPPRDPVGGTTPPLAPPTDPPPTTRPPRCEVVLCDNGGQPPVLDPTTNDPTPTTTAPPGTPTTQPTGTNGGGGNGGGANGGGSGGGGDGAGTADDDTATPVDVEDSGSKRARAARESSDDDGGFPVLPVVAGLVVVGAAGAGYFVWRRRSEAV